MEIIKKKICLEDYRNRQHGSLPFIPYNVDVSNLNDPFTIPTPNNTVDGNWGGFVANIKIGDETYNYLDMEKKYCTAMNILRHGVRVKKVMRDNEETFVLYKEGDKSLFDFIPVDISGFSTGNGILYTVSNKRASYGDYLILIEDYDVFCSIDNSDYDFCKKFEFYVGKEEVPNTFNGQEITGDLVPKYIYISEAYEYYSWLYANRNTTDCCRKDLWKRKGGSVMMDYLTTKNIEYENRIGQLIPLVYSTAPMNGHDGTLIDETVIPTIDIPILLTQDSSIIGLYQSYMEDGVDYTYLRRYKDRYQFPRIVSGYTAESRLEELKIDDVYYDDDGNMLPGIFQKFNIISDDGEKYTSAMYYYNSASGYWERSSSEVYPEEYETVDIAAAIPEGEEYQLNAYLVRFDNNETTPMLLPYKEKVPKNSKYVTDFSGNTIVDDNGRYLMIGDFIISMDSATTEGMMDITYVFGGRYYADIIENDGLTYSKFDEYVSGTGIVYQETRSYNPIESANTFTYGDNTAVTVYYESLGNDGDKKTVYNTDFGLTRECYLANITEYDKMDAFKTYYESSEFIIFKKMEAVDGEAINTPVFAPEYLIGVTDEVKSKADITIDRGTACAFEKHFKLTECNSMEDLENYGNNYFNL